MIVSSVILRTVQNTASSVLCIRGKNSGERRRVEGGGREGQSVAATRLLDSACAMGVTRFQINFGMS